MRRCVLLICGPASDNDAPSIIWTADLREWYRFTPTAADVGQWTLLRDEVALCFHQLFAGSVHNMSADIKGRSEETPSLLCHAVGWSVSCISSGGSE